jgi:putative membrane protein
MDMKLPLLTFVSSLVVFVPLCAAVAAEVPGAGSSATSQETQILEKMHQINQTEIAIGHLAMEKGQSAPIREYGDRLVRDHTMADRRVIAFAKAHDIVISPAGAPAQPSDTVQKLSALSGNEFDRAFVSEMTNGHREAVAMLQSEHDKLPSGAPLRKFLGKMIPILTQHYVIASRLDLRVTAGMIK